MDRETVIALANQAGLEILNLDGEDEVGCGDGYHIQTDLIKRFAALVAHQERQRICKEIATLHDILALQSLPPGATTTKGLRIKE